MTGGIAENLTACARAISTGELDAARDHLILLARAIETGGVEADRRHFAEMVDSLLARSLRQRHVARVMSLKPAVRALHLALPDDRAAITARMNLHGQLGLVLAQIGRVEDAQHELNELLAMDLLEGMARHRAEMFGVALHFCLIQLFQRRLTRETRRIAFENRDVLLAPWTHDALVRAVNETTARDAREFAGASCCAWIQHHHGSAEPKFDRIEEEYDFTPSPREFWSGAVRLTVPRMWREEWEDPRRVNLSAEGREAGDLYIGFQRLPEVTADAVEGAARIAWNSQRANSPHELRMEPRLTKWGTAWRIDAVREFRDGERHDGEWLVDRNAMFIGPARTGAVQVSFHLVTFTMLDGRDDFAGLVARLGQALDHVEIDGDRLAAL